MTRPTKPREPAPEPDTSAAFVPDPPPGPVEREYEVTGPFDVFDHPAGTKFTAVIPHEQAAFLIEAGHIKPTSEQE